jgi:hypothetical protein
VDRYSAPAEGKRGLGALAALSERDGVQCGIEQRGMDHEQFGGGGDAFGQRDFGE